MENFGTTYKGFPWYDFVERIRKEVSPDSSPMTRCPYLVKKAVDFYEEEFNVLREEILTLKYSRRLFESLQACIHPNDVIDFNLAKESEFRGCTLSFKVL